MGKFIDIQTNFSSGLMSKKYAGNIKEDLYVNGCEELTNFLPMKQGGISKLPGTQYIIDVTQSNVNNYDIYPFTFSKSESYVMVFHLTGTSPGPATAFADAPIRIYQLNGTPCTVAYTILMPTFATALTPHGWRMAQLGDVMFITHIDGTFEPIQIIRESINSFRITTYIKSLSLRPGSDVPEAAKIPYLATNISSTSITPSATTGTITLTSSADLFSSTHVGAFFQITHATGGTPAYVTGIAQVTAYTSATVVTASVKLDFAAATASTAWKEAAWSNYRGWPRTVTVFEQRLVWGGCEKSPDTFWGSRINNYYFIMPERLEQDKGSATDVSGFNYYGDVSESDPYSLDVGASEINNISWIKGERVLEIGTLGGGEFIATGGDNVLSSINRKVQPHDNVGSDDIGAILTGFGVVFVASDGKTIRNFRYNETNGSYVSANLSETADDIVQKTGYTTGQAYASTSILKIVYQPSSSILWLLNTNGCLISATLNIAKGVVSWAQHDYSITGVTSEVISMASIRNTTTGLDDLWLLVYRIVNGAAKIYLEKMSHLSFHPNPLSVTIYEEKHWFVNCGALRVASGAGDTTIENLSHLEGYTLRVLADGVDIGEYTVESGVITLTGDDSFDTEAIVGIGMTSTMRTNNLELGANFNTSQAAKKRIDKATLRLMNSKDGKVGKKNATYYEDIVYDESTYGEEFLFTDKSVDIESSPDEGAYVEVIHDKATSFNLLGIIYRGVTYDA